MPRSINLPPPDIRSAVEPTLPGRLRALASVTVIATLLGGCGWTGVDGSYTGTAAAAGSDSTAEAKSADTPSAERPGTDGSDTSGSATPAPSPSAAASPSPTPAASPSPSPAASPSPSPAASPSPSPAPAGAVNNVDTMLTDMSQLNDMTLKGVDPSYGFAKGPGYVIMGNDPRGTNTPDWYKASYPWMVTNAYWNYLLPWFVLFEGQDNAATNTRLHLRNLKAFTKSRSTGAWTQVTSANSADGILCPQGSNYFHCTTSATIRSEASGGISSLPTTGFNLHGWYGGFKEINGPDIAAVITTMQVRLITNGSIDDRAQARYLAQIGADYYPAARSADTVLPAVGMSRAKLMTTEWQSITMTTLSDVGKQEPGGGITAAELRANPPPLD